MERRKTGRKTNSALTISTLAYDFMSLMPGRNISEIRELTNQSPQSQTRTIKSLLESDCIERVEKGKYKITKFGQIIMLQLKTRREA